MVEFLKEALYNPLMWIIGLLIIAALLFVLDRLKIIPFWISMIPIGMIIVIIVLALWYIQTHPNMFH